MDDVDFRFSGLEEESGVQCGNVDAFGQTAGVGEDFALSVCGFLAKPLKRLRAVAGELGAVDMSGFAFEGRFAGVFLMFSAMPDDGWEIFVKEFGLGDAVAKSDGSAGGRFVFGKVAVFAVFAQGVPATNHSGAVVEVDFAFFGAEFGVQITAGFF